MNELNEKMNEKIKFYKSNEIKAHVFVTPKPRFKNGLFVSDLQEGSFYWFIELKNSIPIRLFLNEIEGIEDYMEREE